MNCIFESDIGRDPDDFFALCYFFAVGVPIRAITVSPGDQDQIAIVKFLLSELGLKIPVGSAHPSRQKSSSGGVHLELLSKYKFATRVPADGLGSDIIKDVSKSYTDNSEFNLFACGPLESVGAFLKQGGTFSHATMQGGFLPYDFHNFTVQRIAKFENQKTVPTFNLNGDVESGKLFCQAPFHKLFVPKNVCHTIIYNAETHKKVKAIKPKNRAAELFHEAMDMYLAKHGEKKFHDPTAAVIHLHPQIGTWVEGETYRENRGWGTRISNKENPDNILADIDRDKLWEHISEFT